MVNNNKLHSILVLISPLTCIYLVLVNIKTFVLVAHSKTQTLDTEVSTIEIGHTSLQLMINGHKDKYGSKFTLHYKVGVGELIAQLVTLAHMDILNSTIEGDVIWGSNCIANNVSACMCSSWLGTSYIFIVFYMVRIYLETRSNNLLFILSSAKDSKLKT